MSLSLSLLFDVVTTLRCHCHYNYCLTSLFDVTITIADSAFIELEFEIEVCPIDISSCQNAVQQEHLLCHVMSYQSYIIGLKLMMYIIKVLCVLCRQMDFANMQTQVDELI